MFIDLWIFIILCVAAAPVLIMLLLAIVYVIVETICFIIDEHKNKKEITKDDSERTN